MSFFSFHIWWFISVIVLILFAGVLGKKSQNSCVMGILIDSRGNYSLNHLQIVMWTILVISTLFAVLVANKFSPEAVWIPQQLVLLMGISVGSAATAGAVKDSKNAASMYRSRRMEVADTTEEAIALALNSDVRLLMNGEVKLSSGGEKKVERSFWQIALEEQGDGAGSVVSVTKFQNVIFTAILGIVYVSMIIKLGGFPSKDVEMFSPEVLWLLGISHAGYITGKIPNKP